MSRGRARWAFLLFAMLVGCGHDWLASAIHSASTQYRCVENHINVVSYDDHLHTAILDVCGTMRAGRFTRGRGGDWVPVAVPDGVSGGEDLTARVRREPSANGTDFRLRTEMLIDGTSARWLAVPARDADHVAVTFVTEHPLASSSCPVRAMLDGEVTELSRSGEPTGDAADRTVFVSVPIAFVRSVATSQRAAIRVCDVELQMGADERAVLTELLTRIQEELSWSAPATTAPSTAAP